MHYRQAGEWWTRKVSCVDSPRVSDQYVREMSIRYGDQSNAYRVRVLGEFPVTDEAIAKMGSQESGTTCDENFFCLHFFTLTERTTGYLVLVRKALSFRVALEGRYELRIF